MEGENGQNKQNLYESANLFSRLFFCWTIPLFSKGKKKDLEHSDFNCYRKEDSAKELGKKLQREWKKELANERKSHEPSLLKAAVRTFGWNYAYYVMLAIFAECVVKMAQAVVLGLLIRYHSQMPCDETHCITTLEAQLSTVGVALTAALYTLAYHPYYQGFQEIGMKLRIACSTLIYKKLLRLSHATTSKTTVGHLVNLLSNDVSRFDQSLDFIPFLIIVPLQTIICGYLLWDHVGASCLIGLCIIVFYALSQPAFGKAFATFRSKIASLTDERIRLMSETINGMRLVKMYTLEKSIADRIACSRKRELNMIKKKFFLRGFFNTISIILGKLIIFVSFVSFVLIYPDRTMTAEIVFVSVVLFNCLRINLTIMLPTGVLNAAETLVSFRRIQTVLLEEEHRPSVTVSSCKMQRTLSQCGLWLDQVTAKWNDDVVEPSLTDITATVLSEDLLAILGPVGSGKSSFLMSVLGEIPVLHGAVKVYGKVAYASQEPWIISDSVRKNILFGRKFDERKYQQVIHACALQKDIDELPFGDGTLVGERGMSLSGGQKARINLARAIYTNADIYLLDDPLSAVDSSVANHIFEQCVKNYLKSKVRILVTHHEQFLKEATKILVLTQGKISFYGSYDQLINTGVNLTFMTEAKKTDCKLADNISTNLDEIFKFKPPYQSNNPLKPPPSEENGLEMKNIGSISKLEEAKSPKQIKEGKSTGTVDIKYYWQYLKAGGTFCYIFWLVFIFVVETFVNFSSDFWLKKWTDAYENVASSRNYTNITTYVVPQLQNNWFYIYVYSGFMGAILFLLILRQVAFFVFTIRASKHLHNDMILRIIRAPVSFFDKNPIGRILNRFTKDMSTIDDQLPDAAINVILIFLQSFGVLIIVTVVNPFLIVPNLLLCYSFYKMREFYLYTARDVQRLEGIARSPVFSHVSTSLHGITTIRALGEQKMFQNLFYHHQNHHTRAFYASVCTTRWFGIVLDWMCVVFICLITVVLQVLPTTGEEETGSNLGLALSSALLLSGTFQFGVKLSALLENQMICVERVLEYNKLEPEPETTASCKPPSDWPEKGEIIFDNINLRYSPNEPLVLKNICCQIRQQEKVGIVGRTGAGKSSLIASLFRMTEHEGLIIIDGINTKDIGLHHLRKNISIIPQDPVLFSESIRKNIDLFGKADDSELWTVLDEVRLKEAVESLPGGLDSRLTEGGRNLSVGQRQLICLARTILRRNRILILDEATANIDSRTDEIIQKTIREKFQFCTVLTIAHRLNTVMDCDRVMVLEAGKLVEFDEPHVLLQNNKSIFCEMVNNTGSEMSDHLRFVAQQAFESRHEAQHRANDRLDTNHQKDEKQNLTRSQTDSDDDEEVDHLFLRNNGGNDEMASSELLSIK